MSQPDSRPYTGPSVAEMFRTYTLAQTIMDYHDHPTSCAVLDESELTLLRRFVEHPERREELLAERGVTQRSLAPGDAYNRGSLVVYIMLRQGHDEVLSSEEIEALRAWFERGGGA